MGGPGRGQREHTSCTGKGLEVLRAREGPAWPEWEVGGQGQTNGQRHGQRQREMERRERKRGKGDDRPVTERGWRTGTGGTSVLSPIPQPRGTESLAQRRPGEMPRLELLTLSSPRGTEVTGSRQCSLGAVFPMTQQQTHFTATRAGSVRNGVWLSAMSSGSGCISPRLPLPHARPGVTGGDVPPGDTFHIASGLTWKF